MTQEKETSTAQTAQVADKAELENTDVEIYRSQRDKAIRQAHAYQTMLKAHGISTDNVTDKALEQITIHAGQVDSPFEYKIPDIKVPPAKPPARTATPAAPTLADVKTWSQEKIADNWDMIKELMKKGAK